MYINIQFVHFAAILKLQVVILKMEKKSMADDKILISMDWRKNPVRVMLVSGNAWFLTQPAPQIHGA